MTYQKTGNMGFTLMEVAVVLAVISMLIYGTIKGQELIHQARLKKISKMVEDIRSASNLFYRAQGRLPGDGQVAGEARDGWIKNAERDQFIKELVDNRYLTGKTSPSVIKWSHALGGEVWVEWKSGTAENWIVFSVVPSAADASFVQAEHDGDGNLSSGRVRQVGDDLWVAL